MKNRNRRRTHGGARAGAGRKPRAGATATAWLQVRMTPAEACAVAIAAAGHGTDRSTLVRHALRDWIAFHGPLEAQRTLLDHGGKMPPDPDACDDDEA